MYNSVIHNIMQPPPQSSSTTYPSSQRASPYPLKQNPFIPLPLPSPWPPVICFLTLQIRLLWSFHIKGITQSESSHDPLLPPTSCFQVLPCCSACQGCILFNKHCTVWRGHVCFIHSSVGRHWGGFRFLPLVNGAVPE